MRIKYTQLEPGAVTAMRALQEYVKKTNLEKSLISLIEIRASQINGCAFCLDMHTQDAIAEGETEQRIFCISAWRESHFYTERERAEVGLLYMIPIDSQSVCNFVYDH